MNFNYGIYKTIEFKDKKIKTQTKQSKTRQATYKRFLEARQ